jgi:hypothetical protein
VWRRLLSRSWLWHARSGGEKFPPPQSCQWASRDVHCSCSRLAGACRVAVVQGICQVKGHQVMGVGGAYCPRLRRIFARFARSSQSWRPWAKSDRGTAIGRCGLHHRSSDGLLKIWNAGNWERRRSFSGRLLRETTDTAASVTIPAERERNWGRIPAELPSDGCTDSSLPPADLGCAGHGDQEGGWGGDASSLYI